MLPGEKRCPLCNSEIEEMYGRSTPGYISYTKLEPEGVSCALSFYECPKCKGTGYVKEEVK